MAKVIDKGTDRERVEMDGVFYDYNPVSTDAERGEGWCEDHGGDEGRQPVSEHVVLSRCTADDYAVITQHKHRLD